MVLDLSASIRELNNEKGINEDLIISTVETAIRKAYEKYFGTTENLVIENDDLVLSIYSRKEVVEEVEDDLYEVSLKEAQSVSNEAAVGQLLLIPCNPEDFGRIAIHSAKQIVVQRLKEIEKNTLFSELKAKEGELIIGYIQRMRDNALYIDLGTYEGILPKSNQAPHETYQIGERLKTYVKTVKQNKKGHISVFLTRTHTDFVKKLLEVEIPEIYDKTVDIYRIVREAGYRTKIAVYTNKEEIDPVGACVGQKGNRIQNIIKELEGEKIDVLKWNMDAKIFIENALTPAKVEQIVITDEPNRKAVAIVDESQLSFAIGKRGLNIKLANGLTDWNIDIKTTEQAIELGIITDHVQVAEDLFKSNEEEAEVETEENLIDDLDMPEEIITKLKDNNITQIEQLIEFELEDLQKLDGFTEADADYVKNFVDENFEIVLEEEGTEEVSEEGDVEDGITYYECPECGARITDDQTQCPSCGIEITFEEEGEEDEELDEE